jgi:hypothetical protein
MSYDILYNFISPVTGRVPLIEGHILVGGNDNFSIASSKLIDMQQKIDSLTATSFIIGFLNENLPFSQVLSLLPEGFMYNTAGIVSTVGVLNFAPNDAAYILKTANVNLNQAQALDILGIGMAKIVAGGAFAIAIPDEDYATVATLQELADQAAVSAEEAAASATEAVTFATEASASALEATGAAAAATGAATAATGAATAATGAATAATGAAAAAGLSATGAGISASAAAASATNSESSATQAHDYLNTLLTTEITLQGDITGSGGLSSPITTTFIQNPVFHGNALTINNTNADATTTNFFVQKNGVIGAYFGFTTNTNEAYLCAYGTSSLTFITGNTTRMRLLNNGTLDLLSNDLTTSGNVNATTGTLKGNKLGTHNSGSVSVLNTLGMNNNRIVGLANPISLQDAATRFYVDNYRGSLASNNINVNTNGGTKNWLRMRATNRMGVKIYGLTSTSFIIENQGGESSGIGLDADSDACTIWTPGDSGSILNLQDEDSADSRVAYINQVGTYIKVSSAQRKHSIREKTNNNILNRFLQLSIKTYGYKYDDSKNFSEKKKARIKRKTNKMATGLILEELFELFPNCISDYYNELFQKKDPNKKLDLTNEVKDTANCGIDYDALLCYFIMAFQEFVQKTNNTISKLEGKK